MRIKIISLSVVREKNKNVGNNKKFRVKDIIINTDSESLQNYGEK